MVNRRKDEKLIKNKKGNSEGQISLLVLSVDITMDELSKGMVSHKGKKTFER